MQGVVMEHQAALRKKPDPRVFVSHAHVDDELPDGHTAKAKGFVTYLVDQLGYELSQLGLGRGVWLDRYRLKSGQNFKEKIPEELENSDVLLAIVSYNFVASPDCQDEVSLFVNKLRTHPNGHHCILRIDKHNVANDWLPDDLRDLHTIPFYAKEPGSEDIAEFYWRGKPVRRKDLHAAIKKLANDICMRFTEQRPLPDPPEPPDPQQPSALTVYVAKPAMDLEDAYQTLVRELLGRNIAVVPDPNRNIPADGAAAAAFMHDALAKADLSIHMLGDRRGWQPDGLPHGIVPLQLVAARQTAGLKPNFQRLIWAPRIVPGGPDGAPERDPVEVLAQLDTSAPNDEVVCDTAARFKEFVLQRVLPPAPIVKQPVTAKGHQTSIFVAAAAADLQCAAQATKAIKALGANPTGATFNAGFKAAQTCDHIIICWGAADEAEVLSALQAASQQLTNAGNRAGKLCLLVYPPTSDAKQFALAVEAFGGAHLIVDASQPLQRDSLAPLLGDGAG
jgi:hypothetical protein